MDDDGQEDVEQPAGERAGVESFGGARGGGERREGDEVRVVGMKFKVPLPLFRGDEGDLRGPQGKTHDCGKSWGVGEVIGVRRGKQREKMKKCQDRGGLRFSCRCK